MLFVFREFVVSMATGVWLRVRRVVDIRATARGDLSSVRSFIAYIAGRRKGSRW